MAKVDDAIEIIKGLTLLEVADLVKRMESEFGITAAAPVVAAAPGAGAGAAAAPAAQVEEKTEFDVILKEIGPEKIKVIKAVREVTALGLKEAKDLVEAAPKAVKEGISKDEAKKVQDTLQAAGAVVEVR